MCAVRAPRLPEPPPPVPEPPPPAQTALNVSQQSDLQERRRSGARRGTSQLRVRLRGTGLNTP